MYEIAVGATPAGCFLFQILTLGRTRRHTNCRVASSPSHLGGRYGKLLYDTFVASPSGVDVMQLMLLIPLAIELCFYSPAYLP